MKVKICGVTNLEDALAAVEAGADMLGFNFYPRSSRYLEPKACAGIVAGLAAEGVEVLIVGIFVNASAPEIEEVMQRARLDLAQLSGDEPPAVLKALGERAYKAIRPVTLEQGQQALTDYPKRDEPPALLVDAHHPGAYGGSGQAGDWGLAAGLARQAPILLAGGLNPDNVAAAVAQVRPWGVDVASGVERAPGLKDAGALRAFVANARAASCERQR